jgi:hypothetical protein
MSFLQTPVLYTIDRSNEASPMAGWVDNANGCKIMSNLADGTVAAI